jgi:FkbM family methyltransferase
VASDAGSQLYATPFGFLWARAADADEMEIVVRELLPESTHSYERGPVFIRHGDVVVDAGAHVGAFTRIALLRGAQKVIAFEPQPAVLVNFRRTFATELASGRVVLVEKAVWEQPGTLEFENDGLNFHAHGLGLHSLPPEGKNATRLPATTIDETVEKLGIDRVDFIKMDIEGSERYALRGARRTIAKHKPNMAITVYHRIDDPRVVPEVVAGIRPDYAVIPGPLPPGGPGTPGTLVFFPRDKSAVH